MHGGGPFYSRALRGGSAGRCKERVREVTARRGGRASVLAQQGAAAMSQWQRPCVEATWRAFVRTPLARR
jgi:hypothetical protein